MEGDSANGSTARRRGESKRRRIADRSRAAAKIRQMVAPYRSSWQRGLEEENTESESNFVTLIEMSGGGCADKTTFTPLTIYIFRYKVA